MSTLLEREIQLANADMMKEGIDRSKIAEIKDCAKRTHRGIGFENADEVRRIADRFGRRAK